MSHDQVLAREMAERPAGYQGPNLSPAGLKLGASRLSGGVWALMANIPPKDNNGVIAGRDAALVVDAGITPDMSVQIQRLAGEVTDRPVCYLVNTTSGARQRVTAPSSPSSPYMLPERIRFS